MSLLLLFTIAMTADTRFDRRLQLLFHMFGLSCLGGAIFLQALVFTDILQNGHFTAVENNPAILGFEIALTAFALVYFVYMYQRFIRSVR
jgi:hypothetical protein